MASHNDLGKLGELLARDYLVNRGFCVLHTNWKHSRYEIDMIAASADKLHVIEVKTRRGTEFGFPEESVDIQKFRNIQKAATAYLFQYPNWKIVQFDIISILIDNANKAEYLYIEDIHF